jgi:voltage-gated potassium channel
MNPKANDAVALRDRVHEYLTLEQGGPTGKAIRAALMLLIVISVAAAGLSSMPKIDRQYGGLLDVVLGVAAFGFAIEYAVRIWVAPSTPSGGGAASERLRYLFSLPGIVDLMPALVLIPHPGLNLEWLSVVPIFKLLRYTAAFHLMVEALYSERRVLASAGVLMLVLLVFQSSVVYYFERDAQPAVFGSIPQAMWWGIETLTTVGYGDVVPLTVFGRMAGGLTAVMGLSLFAIPVGIIASAFIEAARRREFVDTWNLVAKVPLFRMLDAARIAMIAGVLRPRSLERGERVIRKGDAGDSMFFIVSGDVEIDMETGAPKGRLSAGEFFGEIALIANRERTATVTALTATKLLVLRRLDFENFMDAHPDLKAAVHDAANRRQTENRAG